MSSSPEQVKELEVIAQKVCAMVKKHGGDDGEVLVQGGAELSVKVRQGKPELIHEAASRALGLRVFRDQRSAVTYTSDLRDEALDRFVAETCELAKLSEPDELNMLPERADFATSVPDLQLWDDRTLKTTAKDALELAKRAEAAALGYSSKVTNSDGATYGRVMGASVFGNTGGFVGGARGTYQSLVVEPLCDDADGKKRNGFYWSAGRFIDQLEDPESVGKKAAERTVAKLGAEKIETGNLPVVFDADTGRALLRLLFSVISGGAIYRKSSYLVGREGSQVASPLVTIVDDPLLMRGPGSRPFDGEGLAARRNVVVEKGVLKTYLFDTYSARKLGRKSNGCAGRGVGGSPHVTTSNFILEKGTRTEDSIVSEIKRGLYVTEMMGFGFNAVTGDFSRGAGGFLIEDGKIGRPVTEVTVSSNFDALLKNIDAVGDDPDERSSTVCPTLRVSSMMIAGR
jgi:PmbA protein